VFGGIPISVLMPAASAAYFKARASNIVFIHCHSSFLCVLNSILCKARKNVTKSRKRKAAYAAKIQFRNTTSPALPSGLYGV
jgi:hypothetical protein